MQSEGAMPQQPAEPIPPRGCTAERVCDDAPVGSEDELFRHVK
jgi:hypothetical protein